MTVDAAALPLSPARRLLPTVLPAIGVGIASSVILLGVSAVAGWLQSILWTSIPRALGVPGDGPWIFVILTLTGIAVGLIVWKVPGHAGPDPATVGLVEAPLPLPVLPGLLLALILMLAGGVSLGPENPIMGVDIALMYAIGSRVLPKVGAMAWVGLSVSGMLGAMFGTPVGAALALSETLSGDAETPLWDRLFAPLVAAGAGSLTTVVLSGGALSMSVAVPPYPGANLGDLLAGIVLCAAAALLGLLAIYAFRGVYALFQRIGNPLLMLTVGGAILGLLGMLGGPITLFKGLDEMKQLSESVSQYTTLELAGVTLIKIAALVVAGTCGFRGGRIFPSVFIGAAAGLFASALLPFVPPALAVACGVLGVMLAITRQGWLSLFLAAVVVPDANLLPLLTLVLLPSWLLVTGQAEMLIQKDRSPA